jgi:tetratricopeptide (TPR) repeat protein
MLNAESKLTLPPVPADQADAAVAAWSEPLLMDTYLPGEPDAYPAFLDSRVYQGSSGRVFPLPFHERIAAEKAPHSWEAVHLENRWLRLVILPQLGGRIHVAYDKTADYDVFYRNNVVKPALVGLAGPWISGGVEFNWPQHHRPATFLPTDVSIEREADGAITVWCSDHDPFARMKGMHGIRLRPDSSLIEARVRLFNRSDETQTFLWWANVAAAVNDDYQSFFPTDVRHVADHAKRAVVTFPRVEGEYYGVDYPARVDAAHPDGDRLDWYRNIPVPTSYMVTRTEDDFFGGYDHGRAAGFVHWADRAISPGKKQWTWGNAPFGWAWDANLTDGDGPYVELMAGVYTDNQPDFSFLAPGETKTFSQYWYPITEIGPAQRATREAAMRLDVSADAEGSALRVGLAVTGVHQRVEILVCSADGSTLDSFESSAAPGEPILRDRRMPSGTSLADIIVVALVDGRMLVTVVGAAVQAQLDATTGTGGSDAAAPDAAVAPPQAGDVATVEELVLIGQYLQQYRHATRSPEPYWQEALRRDPSDIRANVSLAGARHSAGRFEEAVALLGTALRRQLAWAPNPSDGEPLYRLGLALLRLDRADEAAEALAKSAWNAAWVGPASLALARLAGAARPADAEALLRTVLRHDAENLQARDLLTLTLRALGRVDEADAVLAATLALDPLDQWARHLAGQPLSDDAPTLLDVALEYASAGYVDEALRVLDIAQTALGSAALGQVNVGPLLGYHRASLLVRVGRVDEARRALAALAVVDPTNCLPSRLDDIRALRDAVRLDPRDGLAWSLLGSWWYDRGRGEDAIEAWEHAAAADLDDAQAALVERNLGVAAYNVLHDPDRAAEHYAAARRRRPEDARLLFEADQLAERRGASASERLAALEARPLLVDERDDLNVVRARLLTAVGRHDEALRLLASRRFQPWEGGEGQVLGAWDDACLAAARAALAAGDPDAARTAIDAALESPDGLGEARHPLQTTAELHLVLGDALSASGDDAGAEVAWTEASRTSGDFAGMATQPFTERSAAAITALHRLGDRTGAADQLARFASYVDQLAITPGAVDYFATSLPTMLLFHDDPQAVHDAEVAALRHAVGTLTAALRDDATAPGGARPGATPTDPTAPAVTSGDDAGRL